MKWPAIRSTLASIVSDISGIVPELVVWRGEPQARSIVVATRIVLYATSMITVGVDSTTYMAPVYPGDNQVVIMDGDRQFTLSVMVECQQTTDLSDARQISDLVRIRLRRDSVLSQLNAVGLAVSSFKGSTYLEFLASGRTVSQSTLDIAMLAYDQDIDTTAGSGDWIGEAIIHGDLTADGVDNSIDMDVDARNA